MEARLTARSNSPHMVNGEWVRGCPSPSCGRCVCQEGPSWTNSPTRRRGLPTDAIIALPFGRHHVTHIALSPPIHSHSPLCIIFLSLYSFHFVFSVTCFLSFLYYYRLFCIIYFLLSNIFILLINLYFYIIFFNRSIFLCRLSHVFLSAYLFIFFFFPINLFVLRALALERQ